MEITLEKIELVKDRTGVTYKEAKEALEATEGNVVDAIIQIEEGINQKKGFKPTEKSEELVSKIKEIVGKGNVSRIIVKKDEEVLLNIPLNAGIVGALVAPWGIIAGIVASVGFNCVIEFVKLDGSAIDLTAKAGEYYEVVKEKGTEVYGEIKEKGQEAYDGFTEKAPGVYENIKEKGSDLLDKGTDFLGKVKEKAVEKKNQAADDIELFVDNIEEQIEDIEKEIKEELERM